ncbi:DNA-binding response regulator [Lysinibacillus alkalisoli]|uniref:DNA-binding response regulator n=1 Tax=Lysinibacillus alkalisoli TaxID=1911548 RepID=A0A917G7U0_9BACI|nr:response regulator transcription factor [Lysinibacillus alkalisoli]GGG27857.1 DNA-binding response regulator [Lysinibacillus alkalisoli]
MTHILVIEDDASIVKNLTLLLQDKGFQTTVAMTQKEALMILDAQTFDLVLLDLALPDGHGFVICSTIKREYEIPVIFLTASGDEGSIVTGFELGADDYVAKPFRPLELISRIANVLRRNKSEKTTFHVQNVTVDSVRATVTKAGHEIYLSALEYRLLLVFLHHPGQVLSRTRLLEEIWDIAGEFVNDNTLTVYIKRLREKIEDDSQKPTIITTVRGLGYKVGD